MLDVIALVAAGVAIYSSVKHTVKLWHVLVIACASLILVLSAVIPSQFFLIQTFWILFVAGIGVGLVSLIVSYKYRALIEQEQIVRNKKEWEQRFKQEAKQEKIEQEQTEDALLREIREHPEETVERIRRLLTKENTELDAFLNTLPQENRTQVAVAITAVESVIQEEQITPYAQEIIYYILNPEDHKRLQKHTEQIFTQ